MTRTIPTIVRVDLDDASHATALLDLLSEYAAGDTGSGRPLDDEVRKQLPGLLKTQPHYLGLLAFVDDRPAGLANCFLGVSTFRARPLLNIHDIAVTAALRRRGVGAALLARIEAEARVLGCCKITLEVLEGNGAALAAYRQAGFARYALDPAMGGAVFLEKAIP